MENGNGKKSSVSSAGIAPYLARQSMGIRLYLRNNFLDHSLLPPMNKITLLLSGILLFFAPEYFAQIGGLTSFNYTNIPGSARVAAMGGNYFAIKDGDVHLTQFNPSLLDSTMHQKIGLSFVDYFDGIAMGYATYAHHVKPRVTAGATLQFCNYGNQIELDALGYEMGQFSASDYAINLSAAYAIDSLWSGGLTLKTMYSALANYSSVALALEGGFTYSKPSKNFSAALVFNNLGYQVKTFTDNNREKLPFQLQVGIVKRPAHAPFRFSAVYSNMQRWDLVWDNPNRVIITDPITGEIIAQEKWVFGDRFMRHITVGSEFILSKNFNLRVGYNYRRRQELKLEDKPGTAGFSYGFGVRVSKFHISYGRSVYHLAGPSNTISVTTAINAW